MNTACLFALTRLFWSPVSVFAFFSADPLKHFFVVFVIQAAPTSLFPKNTGKKFLLICIIHCYQIGLLAFTDFLSFFPACSSLLPAFTKVTVSTIKRPAIVTALVCKTQTKYYNRYKYCNILYLTIIRRARVGYDPTRSHIQQARVE